jgi:SAM-dependent methyltransferase
MVRVVAFAQRTSRAVQLYGFTGAFARAIRVLRSGRTHARAAAFDRDFGVDTEGIVRLEGLRVRGDRRLGVHYQPSEPDAVRQVLEALPISGGEFVFVDIGSGKGRVVLIASQLPFKRVIGVEFCEEFHDVARANVAAFPESARRCGSVELACMDAAEFEFPADPLVLYFYNPFLEPTMRKVLDNLGASLAPSPRPVFVVMTGDLALAPLVVGAGFKTVADGVFVRS